MSKVLFLGTPSHGHTNPTLGLVSELVKQGEEVIYFSSDIFKEKIIAAGASYKSYPVDMDIFRQETNDETPDPLHMIFARGEEIIEDILAQTKNIRFDYIIHSVSFPFTKVIASILKVPAVSSLAVFAGLKDFIEDDGSEEMQFPGMREMNELYRSLSKCIDKKYNVQLPQNFFHLIFNKSDLNLVYTSEYFISPADRDFFDDTYRFVGPPVYEGKKEIVDFPFEKLKGRKVIYVSLGTVFSDFNKKLYRIFFKSFADLDAVIVITAYKVDLSQFTIPENFIVRNYVPQAEILKYASAAVTHAGINSISDLVHYKVPFVALPLGADQHLLAKRAEELSATIRLDTETLQPQELREAVEGVINDPSYKKNIEKISQSFREAGGYKKAVEEIFKLKKEKGIK